MRDLGHELETRIAASQRALEAQAASPLDGTERMIRRNRGIWQGATVGAAVVGVAAIVVAGMLTTGASRDVPPATPEPAPSIRAVSIAADGTDPTIPSSGIMCGDTAPTMVQTETGYLISLDLQPTTPDYVMPGFVAGSTNVSRLGTRAHVGYSLAPEIVIVRDGEVVGVNRSAGLINPFVMREADDVRVNDFMVSPTVECPGQPGAHVLEPGTYEFYVVSTVANSPEIAALAQLGDAGGVDVSFPEDPWLEPTDAECADDSLMSRFGSVAIACLPARDAHITWDAAARSVTVPYDAEDVGEGFSTQLVVGPFAYEVPEGAGASEPEPAFVGTACGVEVPWDGDANSVIVESPDLADLWAAAGGTGEALVSPTFGPSGAQGRSTQVLVPRRGQGVVIEQRDVFNDEGQQIDIRFVVVAHAAVSVNDGRPVDVSRATGPASVPLDLADVTWCAGEAPTGLAAGAYSMTVYPDQLMGGGEGTPKLRFYPVG